MMIIVILVIESNYRISILLRRAAHRIPTMGFDCLVAGQVVTRDVFRAQLCDLRLNSGGIVMSRFPVS